MVIQHNILSLNAWKNTRVNNNSVSKNLEKLSSGSSVNRAADNAAGLAISEKMRTQIRGITMAGNNAQNAIDLIQTAEGGLNEIHSILQRMRELAVQSSNGTYENENDRQAIANEFEAIKDEMDRIAESTNYNGMKLLNGTAGKYTLRGNHFQDYDPNIFTYTPMGTELNYPVNSASFRDVVELERSGFWDPTVYLTEEGDFLKNKDLTIIYQKDSLEYTETNAAGETYKNKISVVTSVSVKIGSTTYECKPRLRDDWSDQWNFELGEPGKPRGTTDEALHEYFSNLYGGTSSDIGLVDSAYLDNDSFLGFGFYDGDGKLLGSLGAHNQNDPDFPGYLFPNALRPELEGVGQWLFDDEELSPPGEYGISGFHANPIFSSYDYSGYDINKIPSNQPGVTIWSPLTNTGFQISANASSPAAKFQIGNMSSEYLGGGYGRKISDISIATREDANKAIDIINLAINQVSEKRADLGALQNRLRHTINNLETTGENLQAAESSIRDLDLAKEMMGFTKNNILIQASQSMLSQANQLPQGVLGLLR